MYWSPIPDICWGSYIYIYMSIPEGVLDNPETYSTRKVPVSIIYGYPVSRSCDKVWHGRKTKHVKFWREHESWATSFGLSVSVSIWFWLGGERGDQIRFLAYVYFCTFTGIATKGYSVRFTFSISMEDVLRRMTFTTAPGRVWSALVSCFCGQKDVMEKWKI